MVRVMLPTERSKVKDTKRRKNAIAISPIYYEKRLECFSSVCLLQYYILVKYQGQGAGCTNVT